MLANARRTYALREYSVERRAKGWYFWLTYGSSEDVKGPYSSMASVCLMIARQLKREVKKRDGPYNLDDPERKRRQMKQARKRALSQPCDPS